MQMFHYMRTSSKFDKKKTHAPIASWFPQGGGEGGFNMARFSHIYVQTVIMMLENNWGNDYMHTLKNGEIRHSTTP